MKQKFSLQRLFSLERSIAVHETLAVGVALALTGGFLDTYTYTLRGGVFANAQTGNMVLMAVKAADGELLSALYYFIPIAAFFLGVLLTESIKLHFTNRQFLEWQQVVLVLEALLLFIIGFLPLSIPDAVVNVTISFICSVQVQSFRKTRGLPYATTMCTGNLRSAADNFSVFLFQKDKDAPRRCVRYLVITLVFCTGAAAGALCSRALGTSAIWICCSLLLVVLCLITFCKPAEKSAP